MADYRKLYALLFGAIDDALTALEQQNYGTAQALLQRALDRAEQTVADDTSAAP